MKIRFLLLALLPILAFSQTTLKLTGKITGLRDGTLVSLTDVNRPSDTLARARVVKGAFTLTAPLKEATLMNINIAGQNQVITFLESGTIKVSGNLKQLKDLNYTGSALPGDFKAFQKTFDPIFESLMRTNRAVQRFGESDSLNMVMNRTKDSIQKAIDFYISKRPSSAVSAFILAATFQLSADIATAEQRMNSLKPAALKNMYGIFLKETIAEAKITAVGSMAMDFTQADTSGAPISLSSFRGKYVLVDFWASWCGPCRQENPNVVATYQKFNNRNFTVLGISLDRPGQKERWLQAIHADNLTWTHVSDLQYWDNAVAKQYRVQSIPQNFLIGPDGKIVAKNLRGSALEAKLCEVLGGCN